MPEIRVAEPGRAADPPCHANPSTRRCRETAPRNCIKRGRRASFSYAVPWEPEHAAVPRDITKEQGCSLGTRLAPWHGAFITCQAWACGIISHFGSTGHGTRALLVGVSRTD